MATKEVKNQGEGDRQAARRFNQKEQEFAKSEKGKRKIEQGADMSESEAREAKKAEQEGLKPAREEDPQVSRDYKKPRK